MTDMTQKHIIKNAAGTYAVRLKVPDNLKIIVGRTELRRSLGTKDLEEAKRRAPAVVQALRQELDPRKTKRTAIEEVVDFVPDSTSYLRRVVNDLVDFTGAEYIEDLTVEKWQKWCFRREDLKPLRNIRTVKAEATTVRSAISKLMASHRKPFDRATLRDPKWRLPTKEEQRNRLMANSPYTLARWQELYDRMPNRLRSQKICKKIFALGLLTGARVGEIVHAHRDHFKGELWRIPRSKSIAGERTVPLTPMAQELFASLGYAEDGYVFHVDGRNWRQQNSVWSNNVCRQLGKAGAEPNVETMHSTRATFRTLAPRCSQPPEGTIDMIMGHEALYHVSQVYYRATIEDCIEFMRHWRPDIRLD